MEPGKYLQVAVVGVGGVGTQVVEQLIANPIYGFQLVALTSSKRMLQSTKDLCISPLAWKDALNASETPVDLSAVKSTLQELVKQGEKAVFIDNTSSQDVAEMYPALLSVGINGIVQASKSGRYLHESTVGAGLPIISTLRDLVETGDKVSLWSSRSRGVFSGTMSYIFNNFSSVEGSDESFSSIVKGARAQGYTEPNPADDLNGADRVSFPELKDGQGNFPLLHGYQSVETTFFNSRRPASAQDAHFASMRQCSSATSGVVDVKIKSLKPSWRNYSKTHPSDNIIMFPYTERYGKRPLIVKALPWGVVSDILKLIRP
ncbi:hypothetical protein DFJ58DRAFT_717407 [Suillus subalutaceus]|uniref:uncharacterized protein n=1 Tax=Suillus subalutaceus TaxID=48586 RepID=UPI001B85BE22|nr:uncharacterized protein DFJ58DRAFT_717407 [Suillus subalutaceus]KAG1846080.1 hypothetical protein DFJ58DRAFT_717407 [Suillus subalutaceus]